MPRKGKGPWILASSGSIWRSTASKCMVRADGSVAFRKKPRESARFSQAQPRGGNGGLRERSPLGPRGREARRSQAADIRDPFVKRQRYGRRGGDHRGAPDHELRGRWKSSRPEGCCSVRAIFWYASGRQRAGAIRLLMSAAWPRRSRIRAGLPEQVASWPAFCLSRLLVSTRRYADWRRMCTPAPDFQDEEAVRRIGFAANHSMALQASHRRCFRRGRDFSAWRASKAADRLGKIQDGPARPQAASITGAMSVVRNAARVARRRTLVASWRASRGSRCSCAEQNGRITWALTTKKENYGLPASPAKRGKPVGDARRSEDR